MQRRIDNGLLIPLHAGVYAVGHPNVGDLGTLSAARLAIGPGSAVSHQPAAAAWGFDRFAAGVPVDVIVARGRGRGRGRSGIRLHHTRGLPHSDLARVEGIWVTSVPRTLVELCGISSPKRFRRLYEEADRLRLIDAADIAEAIERMPSRKGIGMLKHLYLTHHTPSPVSESHAEHRFFRLWEATCKPVPEVNVEVAGYRVDFLWRTERFIVELDGPSFHDRRGQGERDRVKDVDLALAGFDVHRFGTGQVYDAPDQLIERVSRLLERRSRG